MREFWHIDDSTDSNPVKDGMRTQVNDIADLDRLETIASRKKAWPKAVLDGFKQFGKNYATPIIGRYGRVFYPSQLKGLPVTTLTLQPGETLHIPNGWWHWIYTDAPCITINHFEERIEKPALQTKTPLYPAELYNLSFEDFRKQMPPDHPVRVWNQQTGDLQEVSLTRLQPSSEDYLIFRGAFLSGQADNSLTPPERPDTHDPTIFVSLGEYESGLHCDDYGAVIHCLSGEKHIVLIKPNPLLDFAIAINPNSDDLYLGKTTTLNMGYWNDPRSGSPQQELYELALKEIHAHNAMSLVEFGMGRGSLLQLVNQNFSQVRYEGVDLYAPHIDIASRIQPRNDNHIILHRHDATTCDFGRTAFADAVIAIETVFHYPSREHFLMQVNRTLKSGGLAFLTDIIPTIKLPEHLRKQVDDALAITFGPFPELWNGPVHYSDLAARCGLNVVHFTDRTCDAQKFLSQQPADASNLAHMCRFLMVLLDLGYLQLVYVTLKKN